MAKETLNKPSQAELLHSQIVQIRESYLDQRSLDLFIETYPLSLELGKVKGETSQQVREQELERISALEAHPLYMKDINYSSEFNSMENYHPDLSMQRIIINREEIHDNNDKLTKDGADSIAHFNEHERLDVIVNNIQNEIRLVPNAPRAEERLWKVGQLRTASRMIAAEGKLLHAREVQNGLSFLDDKANVYIAHIRSTNSTLKPLKRFH